MSDGDIDYSRYTDRELHEALAGVRRDLYPQNHAHIVLALAVLETCADVASEAQCPVHGGPSARMQIVISAFGGALAMVFSLAAGFILTFYVIPGFLVWLLVNMFVVFAHRDRLRLQAIKAAVWTTMILASLGLLEYRSEEARGYADHYVHAIERYKATHGACPLDLKSAGLADPHRWMFSYSCENGEPFFFYQNPFVGMLDFYRYDFDKRLWIENAD